MRVKEDKEKIQKAVDWAKKEHRVTISLSTMKKHLSCYGTAKPEWKGHPTKIPHDEERKFIIYIKLM
eukprot:1018318-Rhodomonas_salina.1